MTDLDDAELAGLLRASLVRVAEPVRGDGVRREEILETVEHRRRRTRSRVQLAVAAAAVAAVVAVVVVMQPETDRTTTGDDPPPPSSQATTTDPSVPSTTIPSTTASSPTTVAPPSTTAPSTVPPAPAFPPELTSGFGDPVWAVYLAVAAPGEYEAPAVQAAVATAAGAGYATRAGDLGCDHGAAEALGMDSTSVAVGLYFATREDAEQARAAFDAQGDTIVGVVSVELGCND